jgi:hypothetical protein
MKTVCKEFIYAAVHVSKAMQGRIRPFMSIVESIFNKLMEKNLTYSRNI